MWVYGQCSLKFKGGSYRCLVISYVGLATLLVLVCVGSMYGFVCLPCAFLSMGGR